MNTRLAQVLFTYRVTPQSTTGVSPAELLLHRQPRTRLNLLRPNSPLRVEEKQEVQKRKHDTKSRTRSFQSGDLVFVKNFNPGPQWIPGEVKEVSDPVSYVIQLKDGRQRRCHVDHLHARTGDTDTEEMSQIITEDSIPSTPPATPTNTETPAPETPDTPTNQSETETVSPESIVPTTTTTTTSPTTPTLSSVDDSGHRYPRRNRKQREHFQTGT